MSKASKKMSVGKKRKEISPAGSAKAARATTIKEAADDFRQELESLVASNEKHHIGSWDSVKQKLTGDKAPNCSVFLGNGFNIAVGVGTSCAELSRDLLMHETTKNFLDKERPKVLAKLNKDPANSEEVICKGLKGHPCLPFVKDIFYEKIMKRFNAVYSKERVMGFLALFSKFFTTNYDPLLYVSFLRMKKVKNIEKRGLDCLKVEQLNEGKVTTPPWEYLEEDTVLLKDMTKDLRYKLSKYIMPKGKDDSWVRDDFYKVLSVIGKEAQHEIDFDDGFRLPINDKKAKYMEWEDPKKRKDNYKDNMFYLHGAYFIYVDRQGKTCKIIYRGPFRFATYLRDSPHISPLCIFEAYGRNKKKKIKDNDYLRNCLSELGNVSGNLCIVGWRCHKNDQHLAKCINENSRIEALLVGYCRDDGVTTVKDYTKKFPDKKIIFWDVGEAPFDINKIKEEEKIK